MYYIDRKGDTTDIIYFNPNETEANTFSPPAIYTTLIDIAKQTVMFPIQEPALTDYKITFDDNSFNLLKTIVTYRNMTMLYFATAFEECKEAIEGKYTAQQIKTIEETWKKMEVTMPSAIQLPDTYKKLYEFVLRMQRDILNFVVMLFELMMALGITKGAEQKYVNMLATLTVPPGKTEIPLITQLLTHFNPTKQLQAYYGGGLHASIYKTMDITQLINSIYSLLKQPNLPKQTDTSAVSYVLNPIHQPHMETYNLDKLWDYSGIEPTYITQHIASLENLMPTSSHFDPTNVTQKISIMQQNIKQHTAVIKQIYSNTLKHIKSISLILDNDFSFLTQADFTFAVTELPSVDKYNSLLAEQKIVQDDIIDFDALAVKQTYKTFLKNISELREDIQFGILKKYISALLIARKPILSTKISNSIIGDLQVIGESEYKLDTKQFIQNITEIRTKSTSENSVDVRNNIISVKTFLKSRNVVDKIRTKNTTVDVSLFLTNLDALNKFVDDTINFLDKQKTLKQINDFISTPDFDTLSILAKKYGIIKITDIVHLVEKMRENMENITKSIEDFKRHANELKETFKWKHTPEISAKLATYMPIFNEIVSSYDAEYEDIFTRFRMDLGTRLGGGKLHDNINTHTTNIGNIMRDAMALAITAEDAKQYNISHLFSLYNQNKRAMAIHLWFIWKLLSVQSFPENLQTINELSRIKVLQKKLGQISNTETFGFCTIMMKFIQRILDTSNGGATVVVVDPGKKSFIWLYVVAMLLAYATQL